MLLSGNFWDPKWHNSVGLLLLESARALISFMRQWLDSPRGGGILVTTKLQGDLKIIRCEVVKVLKKGVEFKFKFKCRYFCWCQTCIPPGTLYQAAPLVMPPCWANSLTSESHPGVRGSDILRSRGHEVRWTTSETLTWDGGRHRQRRGLWRSCHLGSGCTEWGCQSCSRHKGSLPPSHLRACWLTPKMSKFKIVLKQDPMMMILTTNGVSMIILMTDSVSGWILWSKLASCKKLVFSFRWS